VTDGDRPYVPVDLGPFCDGGLSLLASTVDVALGDVAMQGIPFHIGGERGDSRRCLLSFGSDRRAVRVPIGRLARSVVFAHRLLATADGPPPGTLVASYRFEVGDDVITRPIRSRFEISALPIAPGGSSDAPFVAASDVKDELLPRSGGPWVLAGRRQVEVAQRWPTAFVLWAWMNPRADEQIHHIEIVPEGPAFVVAAITIGARDEHPLTRPGRRPVRIDLPDERDADRPFDVRIGVDRGVATYPQPLSPLTASEFVGEGMRGWGAPLVPGSGASYVEIAAAPSAEVAAFLGNDPLGSVTWADLEDRGSLQPTPRLRLTITDPGRNWVRTTVRDGDTGEPLACRIHFRSPDGIPFQPHGHPSHLGSGDSTWHIDVGGDVRLGAITYAYIDGTCEGWLPRGEVIVDAACGFEYEPLRARVRVESGQRSLDLTLRRARSMRAQRWFSGDTHVHFLSTQGAHLEGRGEGLDVVNVLQSQWGHLFTSSEEFTGTPSVSPDGRTIVSVSQENRQHLLGHLILLGLRTPVMPWASDGPYEAELGGTLEATTADWADRCHGQGGTVIVPHFPTPNGDIAALVATGRADAAEMTRAGPYFHAEYYRYLNAGYRLPLVAGTDKMSGEVPIGLYRTYVRVAEEPFSYDAWCRALVRGRTFASSGPLIELSVEGHEVGDTVRLARPGDVEVTASASSIFPIHRLEIVAGGEVVAATDDRSGTGALALRAKVRVGGHTWIAARVGGRGYWDMARHNDLWNRGIFAHTSPVYVACGGDWEMYDDGTIGYMLTLIEGALAHVRESPQYPAGRVTHHHGEADHLAYLERPLHEARATLAARRARRD
jgi:hypothetical protein